jgi:hypothetical protein
VVWRVPTPASVKPQVIPSPTAWPFAVKSITSLPFSFPVRSAVIVTDPPQVAETDPAISVDVRLLICHFSSEQLPILGSPFGVDDAQMPEKTELLEDADDDDDDEVEDEVEDEDEAPPPVEEDEFTLDGDVGMSTSDLL